MEPVDLEMTTMMLEPEKGGGGGLFIPGKDRMMFKAPERKSLLGLDILASEKRNESKVDGVFKVPRVASMALSTIEEENFTSAITDISIASNVRNTTERKYRESTNRASISDSPSIGSEVVDAPGSYRSNAHTSFEKTRASPIRKSSGTRDPRYDSDDQMKAREIRNEKCRDRDRRDERGWNRRDYKDRERREG